MKDDVSDIPANGCVVLTGDRSLSYYNGNTRIDYIFNGGKWYLYRTQTSNYGNYDISSYTCVDRAVLNTNAVYEPILLFMSLCMVGLVIYLFFKLIRGFLYAFSR